MTSQCNIAQGIHIKMLMHSPIYPVKQCGRSTDTVHRIEVAGYRTGNPKEKQKNWVMPWSNKELQEK